ncbi:GTPase Era [Hyphomonas sp.]|uniref:GTPase Era n=1 Tax=Hyphomonas sp. TaxID=87 RepID=UPI00391A88D0
MTETEIRRAGFCAIIGAPNAGKSTLTNRLVGAKVAIVTHKVQTTRFPVRGVAQMGDTQAVIVDTPGIFAAKRRLDRAMVKAAWGGAEEADCIVHLIDASAWVAEQSGRPSAAQRHSLEDDRRVISQLKDSGAKALLALNKIDLFPHDKILPVMAALNAEGVYEEIFMISSARGDGIEALEAAIAARMPEGPALYPPDQVADLPMRLLAAEVTREKLMLRLHQELPYQLMVETESWEERADGSVRIQQAVIVGRDGHKAMVLGKGGSLIKEIGRLSRLELSEMLERPVHLFLFVKVDERWQEKRDRYQGLGLDFDV